MIIIITNKSFVKCTKLNSIFEVSRIVITSFSWESTVHLIRCGRTVWKPLQWSGHAVFLH